MKNLKQKHKLQKSNVIVSFYYKKIQIHIRNNNIGFDLEYFTSYCLNRHSFCQYIHYTHEVNKKLYRKYPDTICKEDYKEWLKSNYTRFYK